MVVEHHRSTQCRTEPTGGLAAFFIDDNFKPFPGCRLTAGMRPTHFSGNTGFSETAISPRFGAALTVPRLNWTFRAFYGHFYQAPPLVTASGSLLEFCTASDCGFIPLPGERDEEHQFGVDIPFRGWTLDADTFHTRASNYFDHEVIGESNLFFPLTIDKARVNGWELTLRSPGSRIGHKFILRIRTRSSRRVADYRRTDDFTTNICDPGSRGQFLSSITTNATR